MIDMRYICGCFFFIICSVMSSRPGPTDRHENIKQAKQVWYGCARTHTYSTCAGLTETYSLCTCTRRVVRGSVDTSDCCCCSVAVVLHKNGMWGGEEVRLGAKRLSYVSATPARGRTTIEAITSRRFLPKKSKKSCVMLAVVGAMC